MILFSSVLILNDESLKILLRLWKTKEYIFISGFFYSLAAIFILSFHSSWDFQFLLVTLTGWLFFIEGLFRLIFAEKISLIIKKESPIKIIKAVLFLTFFIGVALITITII